MTELPSTSASQAVLVGTHAFAALEPLPAVAANLPAIRDLLCAPDLWGLAPENCRVVADPRSRGDVLEPLRRAQDATDVLLFYYAGHGMITPEGELVLGLVDSENGKIDNVVEYDHIRRLMLQASAARRIVILDCCFSGRALGVMSGTTPEELAEVEGTFVLTATNENTTAMAPPGGEYTAFTGEFLRIVRDGVPGAGPVLDVDSLVRELRKALRRKSLPDPQYRARNDLGRLALFRNRAGDGEAPRIAEPPTGDAEPPRDGAEVPPLPGLGGTADAPRPATRHWQGRREGRRRPRLPKLSRLRGRGARDSRRRRATMLKKVGVEAGRVVAEAEADHYFPPSFRVLAEPPALQGKRARKRRRATWERKPSRPSTIEALFDQSGEELVLLAPPGLGKSAQLARLTRALAERALNDETLPIPLLLDLATYRDGSLEDWIVEAANLAYDVAKAQIKVWLDADLVLPVLDGLDAVPDAHRPACAARIREYRGRSTGVVVSCRSADEELAHRIGATLAVELAEPSRREIQDFLTRHRESLADVRAALEADEDLWPLLQSPLMIKIVHRTYANLPAPELRSSGGDHERRRLIFDAYLKRALQEGRPGHHGPERTLNWLVWLARRLSERGEQVFHLDRLGSDWLPARAGQITGIIQGVMLPAVAMVATYLWLLTADWAGVMHIDPVSAGGIAFGQVLIALPFARGLPEGYHDPEKKNVRVQYGLYIGLSCILAAPLLSDLSFTGAGAALFPYVWFCVFTAGFENAFKEVDRPVEKIRWTWRQRVRFAPGQRYLATVLMPVQSSVAKVAILGYGVSVVAPEPSWPWVAAASLVLVLLIARDSLEPSLDERRPRPNEGIRRSARYAVLFGLVNAGAIAGVFMVVIAVAPPDDTALGLWLLAGFIGPLFGVLSAVRYGGMAVLLHWIVRGVLVVRDGIPVRLQRFLLDAEQSALLSSTGNGFAFPHRLLQDHLTSTGDDIADRLKLSTSAEAPAVAETVSR